MNVHTTARHFDLTPEVRTHGEERLHRLVRYFDQIHDASITITKEKFRYKVEITLAGGGGGEFFSAEETADPIASIDGAIAALEQQIKKHKGRLIDRREKRGKTGEVFAEAQAEDTDVEGEELETDR